MFLNFVLHFGFALSVLSTLQMFTSGGKVFWFFPSGYTAFVLGPFVYHNQYAAFVEMILPVALWQALRSDSRGRSLANWAMAAGLFASVVAAASRAGCVLLLLEAIAILLIAWSRGLVAASALLRGAAKLGALAVILTAVVGWQVLWERFRQPEPYAVRRQLLASSLTMLRDRPWTGAGLGNWPRAYPRYALFDDGAYVNQAHNDWVQWAVEGAVPFLLILISLAAMAAPTAVRSIWGIGLLSVWLHCMIDYPLQQRPGLGAWFFVLLGILASVRASSTANQATGAC